MLILRDSISVVINISAVYYLQVFLLCPNADAFFCVFAFMRLCFVLRFRCFAFSLLCVLCVFVLWNLRLHFVDFSGKNENDKKLSNGEYCVYMSFSTEHSSAEVHFIRTCTIQYSINYKLWYKRKFMRSIRFIWVTCNLTNIHCIFFAKGEIISVCIAIFFNMYIVLKHLQPAS